MAPHSRAGRPRSVSWGSLVVALALLTAACGDTPGTDDDTPAELSYVGGAACAECHESAAAAWAGSHHDLAMQEVTDATVLADFEGTSFTEGGVTTRFSRSDTGFHVETDGPDGELHQYDVAYVFGVHPLQQYLIELDGGRLQALSVVWDARPAEEGGQRWYHLYPDVTGPDDVLHWTGPSQNWNYMCAECHSTALDKGYDLESNTYATTWEEIDVSCEACHGPGSNHVAWAERAAASPDVQATAEAPGTGRYGLTVELGDPSEGAWVLNEVTGFATRTGTPPAGQVATCARCHSRRSTLDPLSPPEGDLFDSHAPVAIERNLYHADGQILDEVYVWGSFRQSAMYQAGVRCSDCHEPHSGDLRAPGNGVCAQCHFSPAFDTPEHHFHPEGSQSAECVSCHMTAETYMGVDDRRDHSFRVPRPDISGLVGSPDACTSCHADRDPEWAAARIADFYGDDRRQERHFGQALHGGRQGLPQARLPLAALVSDPATPAIVRASALALLAERPDAFFGNTLPSALADPDPQVRAVAARSMDVVPFENRLGLVGPLLNDPSLAVRAQAARVLAPLPRTGMNPGQVRILDRAIDEYVEALGATLDHPSSHVALANLHAALGRVDEAERSLRTALRIGPWFVAGWINLADLYRSLGRDAEGEELLSEALVVHPDQPAVHYALGLLLTRTERPDEALESLAEAARLGADESRYGYAYGLALNDAGRSEEAMDQLANTLERHPNDPDVLYGLTTLHRDAGNRSQALQYARRLLNLDPGNPTLQGLVSELEGGAP